MKNLKFLLVITSLLFSSAAFSETQSSQIMNETAELSGNYISTGFEQENGVVFSTIEKTPRFSRSLNQKLRQLEAEASASLISAVREDSEEFGCTVAEARADIRKCISARAIEISERYVAKLNGQTVGYALYIDNNADAAIIQDGSWIIITLIKT